MTETPIINDTEAKKLATLVYALQAVSFVLPLTFIAAVIVNYVKQDDVRGTIAQSHFQWQIKTFWVALAISILGIITSVIFIGMVILFALAIWTIYRIVKGWLALNDNRPISNN